MICMSSRARVARAAVVFLALALGPTTARAQDGQPYPPDASVSGMKLADWAAALFQWRYSLPRSVDPDVTVDATGERGGIGQRAPVWFLPVFNIGTGTRTITIPEGYAILTHVGWTMFVATPGRFTDAELLARLDLSILDQVAALTAGARLGGLAITDVKPYRVITPVFALTLPPDNLLGIPVTPGADARVAAIAAGHFLLFPPLPVGRHVYNVRSSIGNVDWTINLIVQKPNAPLP
jgi:hypothetical protein